MRVAYLVPEVHKLVAKSWYPHTLKLGGVGINDSEDRRTFSDLSQYLLYYIRSRILRQSKENKYRIIDNKVGDDHRS
jgi:hypothetical protein